MPQTILALLALMMATTFALQQQRIILDTRAELIRNEIALQSTGVAETVLSEIGTRAFDQATVDGDPSSPSSPSELTEGPPFAADMPGDDIDDVDGQTFVRQRAFRGEVLRFKINVEVTYVDEENLDNEVPGPTKAKKATVTVYNMDVARPDTIYWSRSYTCDSRCTW